MASIMLPVRVARLGLVGRCDRVGRSSPQLAVSNRLVGAALRREYNAADYRANGKEELPFHPLTLALLA